MKQTEGRLHLPPVSCKSSQSFPARNSKPLGARTAGKSRHGRKIAAIAGKRKNNGKIAEMLKNRLFCSRAAQ